MCIKGKKTQPWALLTGVRANCYCYLWSTFPPKLSCNNKTSIPILTTPPPPLIISCDFMNCQPWEQVGMWLLLVLEFMYIEQTMEDTFIFYLNIFVKLCNSKSQMLVKVYNEKMAVPYPISPHLILQRQLVLLSYFSDNSKHLQFTRYCSECIIGIYSLKSSKWSFGDM